MSRLSILIEAAPSRADVAFFLRAALTRPGDVPGILRREAARRRARLPSGPDADPTGLACLTGAWEAALEGDAFRCPAGEGPAAEIAAPIDAPPSLTALQTARRVSFVACEDDPAFPPVSLEAARLSLPQSATAPERAMATRAAWVEGAAVSPALRDALRALAARPITDAKG